MPTFKRKKQKYLACERSRGKDTVHLYGTVYWSEYVFWK